MCIQCIRGCLLQLLCMLLCMQDEKKSLPCCSSAAACYEQQLCIVAVLEIHSLVYCRAARICMAHGDLHAQLTATFSSCSMVDLACCSCP
jgi:hypothetical protein